MKSIQPPTTTATTDGTTVSNIQLCISTTSRNSHSCSSDVAGNSQSQDDRDNSINQHPDHHPHHNLEQYINKKVSPIKIRPVLSAESEGTYSGDSSMLERYPFSSIYLPTSINSSIIIIS